MMARNLKTKKMSKKLLKKRLNRKMASVSGSDEKAGQMVAAGVAGAKSQKQVSHNKNNEIHANTYTKNSVSPDGLSTVSKQVVDVVQSGSDSTSMKQNVVK